VKFVLEKRELGKGFANESFGKRMRTKGVAEEPDASGNFRGMVPRVGVEEGDGAVEVVSISFGEIGRRWMASDGGENVGFGKGEFDSKRMSEFAEFFKEEGEVGVGKSNGSIVNDGSGVWLGAKKIIVRLLVVEEAELRAFKEECINLFE
jgi:hypothetical protein